jgi:peptidoglycan/LPS O-acetylase OafA/YrhL
MLFMISWYHIWQQSWLSPALHTGPIRISLEPYVRAGYMMVDGIILLSAFVLFLPYARQIAEKSAPQRIGVFYVRRASRILPSYYLYLVAMAILLPFGSYESAGKMWTDIIRHVTFTHTFFRESYLYSPLGMIVWTLGIEAQAYLIFPLLAAAAVKKPYALWPLMIGAAFLYRGLVMRHMTEYAIMLNQLPAFLDVYAIGMGFALLYVFLAQKIQKKRLPQAVFTALAAVMFILILSLLRDQARESGQSAMHIGQMQRRFPLAICFGGLFLSSALSQKGLRVTLGNRFMSFAAGVTLNYYLWHPAVCQLLKRWHIPPYISETPHQAGETAWQSSYTYLCFCLAFAVALAITYTVEKPAGKWLTQLHYRRGAK